MVGVLATWPAGLKKASTWWVYLLLKVLGGTIWAAAGIRKEKRWWLRQKIPHPSFQCLRRSHLNLSSHIWGEQLLLGVVDKLSMFLTVDLVLNVCQPLE